MIAAASTTRSLHNQPSASAQPHASPPAHPRQGMGHTAASFSTLQPAPTTVTPLQGVTRALVSGNPPTDAPMPDWPVWASVVAVVIVALAAFCAVRHSHRALGALWAIARRKTPPRLLWAFRSIRVPRVVGRVACIALLYATAAAAGAGVTTWAMARGTEPQMATAPVSVNVPLPATARPAVPPSAPVTFVRAIVPVLERQGLTRRQALLFTAHLARETGWGRWVRGNNFGNIKAGRGWTGRTFTLTDARGFRDEYRAWPTLEQGVESTLALIRDSARYRKAWKLLRAGDVRWYGQLGLDGYYEGPTGHAQDGSRFHTEHDLSTVTNVQREYEGIVALATQYEGSDT